MNNLRPCQITFHEGHLEVRVKSAKKPVLVASHKYHFESETKARLWAHKVLMPAILKGRKLDAKHWSRTPAGRRTDRPAAIRGNTLFV